MSRFRAGGNVWVHSDNVCTTVLTRFAPDGQVPGQIPIGGITAGDLGHLDRDPATGLLWHLARNGNLRLIDPAAAQGGLL